MPVTNYHTVNGRIVGETTSGVRTDYMRDALGSVTGTTIAGVVQNTYRWKPYGGLLAKTGTAADPKFQWNGGSGYRATTRAHSDYYVRARHFGSAEGLWSSVDKLWPAQQTYGYAIASPTLLTDGAGSVVCGTSPPTCGSVLKWLDPSKWNRFSETICCIDTGSTMTLYCMTDPCVYACTELHESVHVGQITPCCLLANLCFANANGNIGAIANCDWYWGEYINRNTYRFEADAYFASSMCFDAELLAGCSKKGQNASTSGQSPTSDPCCTSWGDAFLADSLQFVTNSAAATMQARKKHPSFDCPFDGKGNVKGGW